MHTLLTAIRVAWKNKQTESWWVVWHDHEKAEKWFSLFWINLYWKITYIGKYRLYFPCTLKYCFSHLDTLEILLSIGMVNLLGSVCQKFGKCLSWLLACPIPPTREKQFSNSPQILGYREEWHPRAALRLGLRLRPRPLMLLKKASSCCSSDAIAPMTQYSLGFAMYLQAMFSFCSQALGPTCHMRPSGSENAPLRLLRPLKTAQKHTPSSCGLWKSPQNEVC